MQKDIPELLKTLNTVFGSGPISLGILGALLLYFTYIIDHWGKESRRFFVSWKFDDAIFSIGVSLIFLSVATIIFQLYQSWRRIKCLEEKYPIKDINKKFYLIKFAGVGYLFEKGPPKKRKWVASWQTASDLKFHGFWLDLQKSYYDQIKENPKIKIENDIEINLNEFELDTEIHTRGIPGS